MLFTAMVESYIKQRELEISMERTNKYRILKEAIEKFYLDLEATRGWVDIPYFKKASEIMQKKIKTDADIDYYYNRFLEWKRRQTA
jgi:hypothetical protein